MPRTQESEGFLLAAAEAALVGPAREPVLYSLVMRPHRSLSRAKVWELALWSAAGFGVLALHLAVIGAWPAAMWLWMSGLGLGLAFILSERQRRRFELVRIGARSLEHVAASPPRRVRRQRLPSAWARVELSKDTAGRPHLFLCHRRRKVPIGGLLPPDERAAVADELADALLRLRQGRLGEDAAPAAGAPQP